MSKPPDESIVTVIPSPDQVLAVEATGVSALAVAATATADAAAVPPFDPAVVVAPVGGELLRRRLRTWAGILSAYFGTQTVTQLLGILAGLLFIRNMPVQEFALYTLASSVITFFAFSTDLGSTTSLLHFYRRAQQEGDDFSRYLSAVLSLRRMAFAVGAVAVCLALPAAALAKGFRPLDIGLATLAVLAAVAFQIVAAVRVLALRLHDRYGQSYRAEMAGAALRLLLAAAMVAAALLQSWLGLLVAAAGSALTAWLSRDRAATAGGELPSAGALELRPYRRAILRYLLPTLPSALYFAVQGPLIIWLAATFGQTRNIAEVGALGRLGLIVGIFSGLTGVVFLPRLARLGNDRLWRRRTLQFGAVHLLIACAVLLGAWLMPDLYLWLLGKHYAGLKRELLLIMAGAGLTLLGGYAVSVNFSRSWIRWESFAALLLACFQVALLVRVPMTSTSDVLGFNAASAAFGLLLQVAVLTMGFKRPSLVQWT